MGAIRKISGSASPAGRKRRHLSPYSPGPSRSCFEIPYKSARKPAHLSPGFGDANSHAQAVRYIIDTALMMKFG